MNYRSLRRTANNLLAGSRPIQDDGDDVNVAVVVRDDHGEREVTAVEVGTTKDGRRAVVLDTRP